MEILTGILIGVIITYISVKLFGIENDSNKIDEVEARSVELARQLKEALNEDKELKEIRRQTEHNNTLILERNRTLEHTIKEIETVVKEQQFNSVTNLQNKINHILMTAKSK